MNNSSSSGGIDSINNSSKNILSNNDLQASSACGNPSSFANLQSSFASSSNNIVSLTETPICFLSGLTECGKTHLLENLYTI